MFAYANVSKRYDVKTGYVSVGRFYNSVVVYHRPLYSTFDAKSGSLFSQVAALQRNVADSIAPLRVLLCLIGDQTQRSTIAEAQNTRSQFDDYSETVLLKTDLLCSFRVTAGILKFCKSILT